MLTISFVNQKGGVGKTTLAIHTAEALARKGNRVLLVDADPQGSSLDWSEKRAEQVEKDPQVEPCRFSVVGLPTRTIHTELPSLGQGYDVVIIDGPARYDDVSSSAMVASDLVLIPVQPSQYDIWASEPVVKIINDVSTYHDLKAAFVVNARVKNTAIGRAVKKALTGFDYPLIPPIIPTSITRRVSFAECATQGLTVFDTSPRGEAAKDITKFIKDVLEFVK